MSSDDKFEKDKYLCVAVHSGNPTRTKQLLPLAGNILKNIQNTS